MNHRWIRRWGAAALVAAAAGCTPPGGAPAAAVLGPQGGPQLVEVALTGAFTYASGGPSVGAPLHVERGDDGSVQGLTGVVAFPGRGADRARLEVDLDIEPTLGVASGSIEVVDPAAGLRAPINLVLAPVRLTAGGIAGSVDAARVWRVVELLPVHLEWSVQDGTGPLPADPPVPTATSGSLRAITYNVAGLPEPLSGSQPATNNDLISPLLRDYDLALLQEDFFYADRVAHALDHPWGSEPDRLVWGTDPTRPEAIVGSGLERYSRSRFVGYRHVRWPGCFGGILPPGAADCLSQKGFTVATHTLADGVEVDVYDLHGEAGSTDEDERLTAEGYAFLAASIRASSAGRAVIVGGDFNLHREEPADRAILERFAVESGLTDVCEVTVCDVDPDTIDRFFFRSSDAVRLTPRDWDVPSARFSRADGTPLSDHHPSEVTFDWERTDR